MDYIEVNFLLEYGFVVVGVQVQEHQQVVQSFI